MTPPQILRAIEPCLRQREPPPPERCTAHKWLNEKAREEYAKVGPGRYELYLSKLAEEKIRNHASAAASQRLEVMGLLLGNVFTWNDVQYSIVRDVATTDLDSSSVRVRFSRDGMERLFAYLEEAGFKYVIVGWYHSHPGHRCFLSPTDVETQKGLFNKRFHSAIVIDPINKEIESFFIENGKVRSRPFAVYWDEYQNPYFGETVRRKKLADVDKGKKDGN
ncbi:MAG: Mov34/MPN/PAD-1 family protein [Methanomassiliicoccales archaeon]